MNYKGYTTREEIENYLLITIDPGFYTQIRDWAIQVEAYIDLKTGRNFKADATAAARLFDGDGSQSILIDDCVSIDEVKVDGEVVSSDDYYLYPSNETPKTKIVLASGRFAAGRQNVKITAKWGYSVEVPDDIRAVATAFVAGIINFSDRSNSVGEVQSMTIGRYSVTYKTDQQKEDLERIDEALAMRKKITF